MNNTQKLEEVNIPFNFPTEIRKQIYAISSRLENGSKMLSVDVSLEGKKSVSIKIPLAAVMRKYIQGSEDDFNSFVDFYVDGGGK